MFISFWVNIYIQDSCGQRIPQSPLHTSSASKSSERRLLNQALEHASVVLLMIFELPRSKGRHSASCISTPPYPTREASQYKVYPRPRSGTIRLGAVVNLVFSSWNDSSHASVHTNLTSFRVRRVRGEASLAKSCTNLL